MIMTQGGCANAYMCDLQILRFAPVQQGKNEGQTALECVFCECCGVLYVQVSM
jgi:hypothetical protein